MDAGYRVQWFHEIIGQKLQEALQKVLRGERARLILELPPRHGKSEMATVKFPAWVLGNHPEIPIIVASYGADLAEDFGMKTRDLMSSPVYRAFYNTRIRRDTTAKGKWLTQAGGGYTATGVGGSITGKGFKIGIIDDPFKNREEADSEIYRDRSWSWYLSTFYTRQEGYGAIIVICTRWHTDDLVGRLKRQEEEARKEGREHFDEWEVVHFPAIATQDEEYRKTGDPLWPDKFNLEKLANIRQTLGVYEWSALYQQTPISSENQEFKIEWFKKTTWPEVNAKLKSAYLTVDTALKKKEVSDFTGYCINFVDIENHWHLKSFRKRVNARELVADIFTLHEKYHFDKIGVEKTAFLEGLRPFIEEECRRKNKFLPLVELYHRQLAKDIRIRGLVPRYESGNVFHLQGECADLEEELLTFPKSLHDDVMDSAAYQLQIAQPPVPNLGGEEYDLYKTQYH